MIATKLATSVMNLSDLNKLLLRSIHTQDRSFNTGTRVEGNPGCDHRLLQAMLGYYDNVWVQDGDRWYKSFYTSTTPYNVPCSLVHSHIK